MSLIKKNKNNVDTNNNIDEEPKEMTENIIK